MADGSGGSKPAQTASDGDDFRTDVQFSQHRLTRGEKLTLVVLAVRLKATTGRTIKQFWDVIRIVKPKTVFGWHRGAGALEMDVPAAELWRTTTHRSGHRTAGGASGT